MLELRVLGPLEIVEAGRARSIGSTRQRDLLALLIVHANETVATDRIIDELWADEPPDGGARAVAFHIAKLRDALAPGRRTDGESPISTRTGGYALRIDPECIDAVRFERLAAEGRGLATGDPEAAACRLREALAVWHGRPFADVDELQALVPEIRRLEELRLRAIEDRIDAELACGRHAEIVSDLEQLVDQEPLQERLRGQLMLALYRSGRQASALQAYQDARLRLATDLGIDPSPELQRLQASILQQDPGLLVGAATGRPRNPYKGLRPFAEADAADFHGREALVARLVERLSRVSRAGRLLAVIGPSGSGKSSVIRAGLVPALRRGALPSSERWPIVTVFPGARPFEELAAGLAGQGVEAVGLSERFQNEEGALAAATRVAAGDAERLVLIIDQLEELYLLVADDSIRTAFLTRLAEALADPGSRLVAVVTLRADMFDRPLAEAGFGELVRNGTEAVTPLTAEELEQAIVRPAADAGLEVEAGLVSEMVGDVAGRAASLPLLQYALTELVESGDGRHLTREGYRGIGGVAGALGRRAEELFAGLDPDERTAARQLFLRLVAIESGGMTVPCRTPLEEVRTLAASRERIDRVLDIFGGARLLAFDHEAPGGDATVEVAHEALISRWPRLSGWIDDERDALWIRHRLVEEAREWDRVGRDPAFLLADARLDRFEQWATATDLELDDRERAILDASREDRRRRDLEAAARAAREARLRRWRVALVGVLVGVAGLAVALGAIVARQEAVAQEERDVTDAREVAAASVGTLSADPGLAILLAIEAARATMDRGYVTIEAVNALDWALQEAHVPYPGTGGPIRAAVGPGGLRTAYVVAPEALIGLAVSSLERSERWWTREECSAFLQLLSRPSLAGGSPPAGGQDHAAPCPGAPPATSGTTLRVLVAGAVVEAASLGVSEEALAATAGAHVRVASEMPLDIQAATPVPMPAWAILDWSLLSGPELDARLASGDLPDVAIIARPGKVRELALRGTLIDLSTLVDIDAALTGVIPELADPGLVATPWAADGPVGYFGLPVGTSVSGLVWYRRDEFARAGYSVPGTWGELLALSDRIVADGSTPWCLGAAGTATDGAGPADWLEELVLRRGGPDTYRAWADNRRRWDEGDRSALAGAFDSYGELVFGVGHLLGGRETFLATPHEWSGYPLLGEAPRCWMTMASGPEEAAWPESASSENLEAFPLPDADDRASDDIRGRAYYLVVLRDRPEVRAFVARLLDPADRSVAAMGASTGVLPARALQLDKTLDGPVSLQARLLGRALAERSFQLDASDRMSPDVGDGVLPVVVLSYLQWGPDVSGDALGRLLDRIEVAREATR